MIIIVTMHILSDTIKASMYAYFALNTLVFNSELLVLNFYYTFWLCLCNKLFKSEISFHSKEFKN